MYWFLFRATPKCSSYTQIIRQHVRQSEAGRVWFHGWIETTCVFFEGPRVEQRLLDVYKLWARGFLSFYHPFRPGCSSKLHHLIRTNQNKTMMMTKSCSNEPPPKATLHRSVSCPNMILTGKRKMESATKVWQRKYCEYHCALGHTGYCYAWLDNGFCPSFHLYGSCRMTHAIPVTWTATQKKQHDAQRVYMDELWKDSALLESGNYDDGDDDEDITTDLPAHLALNDGPTSKKRRVGDDS